MIITSLIRPLNRCNRERLVEPWIQCSPTRHAANISPVSARQVRSNSRISKSCLAYKLAGRIFVRKRIIHFAKHILSAVRKL